MMAKVQENKDGDSSMAKGQTTEPGTCRDCPAELPIPRNPRTVRCAECRAAESKRVKRAAQARYKAKVAADPKRLRDEYDANNRRRRELRATDPEFAERSRESVRRAVANARANPDAWEARRAYVEEWRRQNPDKVSEARRRELRGLREAALAAYGGRCACCGEDAPEFLAIDHVNGDGAAHRREISGGKGRRGAGTPTYRWLKKSGYPEGFRVLCHNCNIAIGFYGACPHASGASSSSVA